MENNIENIQNDFIEMIGNLCASMNITRIIGQIYALLYMSEEPVSMDEIVKKLNVSKGNVSVNINILEGWGAVRRVWVKGSRKNFYTADPDIWKLIKDRANEALSRRLGRVSEDMNSIDVEINRINSSAQGEDKRVLSFYAKRLNEVDAVKEKMLNILKTLKALNTL